MSEPCAIVWMFDEAPKELRDLSNNGGDEDWLVEFNDKKIGHTPVWIESIGICNTDIFDHPTKPGWCVAIGSHA